MFLLHNNVDLTEVASIIMDLMHESDRLELSTHINDLAKRGVSELPLGARKMISNEGETTFAIQFPPDFYVIVAFKGSRLEVQDIFSGKQIKQYFKSA